VQVQAIAYPRFVIHLGFTKMENIDRYQQGFNDLYHWGEPDPRLVDNSDYMAGFMAADTRCHKPFEEKEEQEEDTLDSED